MGGGLSVRDWREESCTGYFAGLCCDLAVELLFNHILSAVSRGMSPRKTSIALSLPLEDDGLPSRTKTMLWRRRREKEELSFKQSFQNAHAAIQAPVPIHLFAIPFN